MNEAPRELSFPGGGRILFQAQGPEYQSQGVGVVEADGTIQGFPAPSTFPYWAPVASDRLLMLPFDPPPETTSYEIMGDSVHAAGSWRTSTAFHYLSLDGRIIAFVGTHRSGRVWEHVISLPDRATGHATGQERTVPSVGLAPVGWTPNDESSPFPGPVARSCGGTRGREEYRVSALVTSQTSPGTLPATATQPAS
jgi:hypothetical protein